MEDFVPFEIAIKLKEKGFEWETSNVYERNIIACRYEDYPKPTISQVLDWLRKEKKISIEPGIHCSLKWMCGVYGFSDGLSDFTPYDNDCMDDTIFILYDTYEKAALAGIEYVLDNLI